MIKNKYLLILVFFIGVNFASSTSVSGQVEYFYMTRLENSKLVNIPFRLLDLNIQHQISDDFNIIGDVGIEYRNRRDTDFMSDSNLEDFLLDIRELYMSLYVGDGEFRIGKQIHSWGSVDENSPIDNLNAYDYYYLLLGGAEKKLGSYSLAYDLVYNQGTGKFSFVYSPMHNTNRIPINDPDYPIGLPAGSSPSAATTLLNDVTPGEYGLSLTWSFDFGDISLSQLGMYDRNFNLSGLTIYTDEFSLGTVVNPVPRYSYRYTDIINIGAVFLANDFTVAFDYANFNSEDQNDIESFNALVDNPFYMGTASDDIFGAPLLWDDQTRAFEEKVKYSQLAIQFEMPFENDFKVNAQYFKHDVLDYQSNKLNLNCDELVDALPQFSEQDCEEVEDDLGMSLENFEPENLFIPGVGTPYAMITSEGVLLNFEKGFPDSDLTIDFNAFIDADKGDGKLLSIEFEHDLGDGFELSYGITKILGDDSIENYNFNRMESFSSFRSRITYYF
tara:strand:+ start:1654 stop:3159 length:1506 start_codon:yes stop_codon:yes gene_type:complete